MKPQTIRTIGTVIGTVGCIAADIATTTILKRYAPEVTRPLHKLAMSAGIGFIGYMVGSNVEATVKKDTEQVASMAEQAVINGPYVTVTVENKEG